jgi:hypothetical protein
MIKNCENFFNCTNTKDENHRKQFRHICMYDLNCKNKDSNSTHRDRFIHTCPLGLDCKDISNQHRKDYRHPCINGNKCSSKNDSEHSFLNFHLCEESNCSKINDKTHSHFVHICPNLNNCNDKSQMHQTIYLHNFQLINFLKNNSSTSNQNNLLNNNSNNNTNSSSDSINNNLNFNINNFNLNYSLKNLNNLNTNYIKISTMFSFSLPNAIIKIEELDYPFLKIEYDKEKLKLETKYNKKANEKLVFYKGDSNFKIENLIKNGINPQLSSDNGLGKGSYFGVNASYTLNNGFCEVNQNNEKILLVATIIIGDPYIGKQSIIYPPIKPDNINYYDSVTDNLNNPSIYVVFHKYKILIKYVVYFK